MAEVTYADPTTTRTPLHFDVMPPIQQASPIVNPPAVRQPFNVQQTTPGQLARPIDYHAQPHTVPSVQQQIKLDGETWITIDVTPNSSARPRINTTQSVLAGTNVVSGNSFAQEQAAEAAAYFFGVALVGLWDGAIEGKNYPNEQLRLKRDPSEDAAYTIGQKVGDELRHLGLQGKSNLEDLWKNRPQFEIPTIQIPKFDRPGMPDFSIPKIPEFDIPKLPKPQSKPQPTTKEKDIPRIDKPKQPWKEPTVPPNSNSEEWFEIEEWVKTKEDCEMFFRAISSIYYSGSTIVAIEPGIPAYWLEKYPGDVYGGGEDGTTIFIGQPENGQGIAYFPTVGGGGNSNGQYGSDYMMIRVADIRLIPKKINNFSQLKEYLSLKNISPFGIYSIDWRTCKTRPQGKQDSPPPLPPQDCDCTMTCCPEIDYRKIKALIDDAIENLPIATPDSWLIRPENHRPQLIIQFGEMLGNKKIGSPKYPLTIPHPKPNKPNKSVIPAYKKGNWEIIYVLKDNSKITIHALNEIEGMKVLNAAKSLVISDYVNNGYLSKSGKVITKTPLNEVAVTPKMAKYFPNGRKSEKPEWIVKF